MESKAYGRAGIIAEEVISSIRTVLSYNGQAKELRRFVWRNLKSMKTVLKQILFYIQIWTVARQCQTKCHQEKYHQWFYYGDTVACRLQSIWIR